MADVQDETKETEPAAAPLAAPPLEQGAIRGAFLARAAQIAAPAAGGGIQGDDTGAASLKGAFIRHLTEKRSGAVVGDETGGDAVVRSIYAARSAPAAAPGGRRAPRKAKAAPVKKGRARAAAKPARPVKRAAKKRAGAAAGSRRPAKTRRPAASPRKRARKTRR